MKITFFILFVASVLGLCSIKENVGDKGFIPDESTSIEAFLGESESPVWVTLLSKSDCGHVTTTEISSLFQNLARRYSRISNLITSKTEMETSILLNETLRRLLIVQYPHQSLSAHYYIYALRRIII